MLVFDTLAFAEKLEKVNFTRDQAKILTEEIRNILDDNVATKQDLLEVKRDLQVQIEQSKNELLKWMIGLLLAQTGVVAALVKLL